jgi:hypothetical protein
MVIEVKVQDEQARLLATVVVTVLVPQSHSA